MIPLETPEGSLFAMDEAAETAHTAPISTTAHTSTAPPTPSAPADPSSRRAIFSSVSTAILICCVLVSIPFPRFTLIAGVAAAIALIGTLLVATTRTRNIALLLTGIGVVAAVLSIILFGMRLETVQLGRFNQDLVAMLASGAFIRGVLTFSDAPTQAKLRGRPAVLRTAFVTSFVSSVLNMVSIGIIGDRLERKGRLSMNNAALLAQSYAVAALWSPFWTITALVVVYFPTVSLLPQSMTGIVFAIVLLFVISFWNASRRTPEELQEHGYSLQPRMLFLPLALIVIVLGGHFLIPDTPVPRLVTLASLAVPLVFGLARLGVRTTANRFARVVTHGLTSSANESSLFIAAGIFTVGGSMLFAHLPFNLSSVTPTVLSAWLLSVAIVLLAMVGVHPIVSISIASAMMLLVPGGETLYAAAIAWGWCIAAPIGPLAGTVIYISQRYRLRDRSLIAANFPFAIIAIVLAFPAIWIVQLGAAALGLH